MLITMPNKYNAGEIEQKWAVAWQQAEIYHYDESRPRHETFVIDTPPPTVSGALHMGHVFSYTQTDVIVRFQRMLGKNIFYPIGWDNNGLPTERRVQNLYAVKCMPHVPYQADFEPTLATKKIKEPQPISRKNFLELCVRQTEEDQTKYRAMWTQMGLSFDWRQEYATVSKHCQTVSQYSFIELARLGHLHHKTAPTMWDVTFQTAVALAEVEERPATGHFHDIRFEVENGESFIISTTRPELLAACVAVVAHHDDERYQHLFGKNAITPLFYAPVPIMPAEHADPEKGTGILMVCTFGDSNDIEFWKERQLPLKQIVDKHGKLKAVTFGESPFVSQHAELANQNYETLKGCYVKKARQLMVQLLGDALVGEPRATEQAVKYYEKGELPLEYVPTRQWFIDILSHKKDLLSQGDKIHWSPTFMQKRYQQWVEGLNQDWCISRQRFFGVAIPAWYPLDNDKQPQYDQPIFPSKTQLPVDPLQDCPVGYTSAQRGQPGGFIGDPDVMDTWATSSLSPQVNSHWSLNDKRHDSLYPADLRPQAHEIIRTWAFYTITKSWLHENKAPWKNIVISGWVVNSDHSKMSKSKGNTVTPDDLLKQFSADALRYWATRANLGHDTIFDESVFKVGQKLVTKIFNAAKFVLLQLDDSSLPEADQGYLYGQLQDITEPVDCAWVKKIAEIADQNKKDFEAFDYATVLNRTETAFWDFCDNYIELVKARAYQQKTSASGRSAISSLLWSLKTFVRMFSPVMPFVCEEVWSWYFANGQEKFVSIAIWPTATEVSAVSEAPVDLLVIANKMMNAIRSAKTAEQKNMKWPVSRVVLSASAKEIEDAKKIINDISAAGHVAFEAISYQETLEDNFSVAVELGSE